MDPHDEKAMPEVRLYILWKLLRTKTMDRPLLRKFYIESKWLQKSDASSQNLKTR
jgi:hypothetical protein